MRRAMILAAALALAACQPAERPGEREAIETPMPPAAPTTDTEARARAGVPPAAPIQSTLLGEINGCRIYRVSVDGRSYVLAAGYAHAGVSNSGYAARACSLIPAGGE